LDTHRGVRAIGDTVNLAARLEAHTKVAGRGILIDDTTRRALGSSVPTQTLGELPLKGKAAGVRFSRWWPGSQTNTNPQIE
jgi:class 3 adenylate cyclase